MQHPVEVLLECQGVPGPVLFKHCPQLLDLLPYCYLKWPFEACRSDAAPSITVSGTENGYTMVSRRQPKPIWHRAPLDMACAFIAELFWPLLEANPGLLCLHGAAAEFSGRLVVFPNRYHAGKSLLSACLAAKGIRLFTDDVLPVEIGSGLGMAMGIRPRLRTPLPDDLSPGTEGFLRSRWGPSSERYGYLALDQSEMARAGEKLPLGGFVILERGERTELSLSTVSRGEILRQVIWQNFARDPHSATIIERLGGIVERSPCYKIRYQHAEDAVALLLETFGDWSQHRIEPDSTVRTGVHRTSSEPEKVRARQYVQGPGIYETTLDGERFLAGADGKTVYHLNPVGSGIWQALAEPMTGESLIDLVSTAFPDTDKHTIECDVRKLIEDLLARNLIVTNNS